MQHTGKQQLNQIIHSISYNIIHVLQVNSLFFMFQVCAVFCACNPAHPNTVTHRMEWGWCPHRLCRCAFVSSSLCQVHWGHRADHVCAHLRFQPLSWIGLIPFGALFWLIQYNPVIPEVNKYQTLAIYIFHNLVAAESCSLNVWSLTGLVFFTCKSTLVLQSL